MVAEGLLGRSARTLRGLPRRRPPGRRATNPAGLLGAIRRRRAAILAATVVLALGLGGGWLWLRHSPLVSVQHVRIRGLTGPDAGQIRSALVAAARGMTTLDVHKGTLRAAVAPYPIVRDLAISSDFPHGLTIRVTEQVAVATVTVGDRAVPVAADGTLLRDVQPSASLPAVALKAAPGGPRVEEAGALAQLRLLAGAPYALLSKVVSVSTSYWHGYTVALRSGPVLYFGDSTRLSAKWQAAVAVLAAPATAGASYVDVSDPQRPAAGTGNAGASATTSVGTTASSGALGSTEAGASSAASGGG